MSDWLELSLRLALVINPIGAGATWASLAAPLDARERPRLGVLAGVAGCAALAGAALAAGWLLDLLAVSAPTWQIGAALLLIFGAVPAFLRRDPFAREPYGARGWAATRMALNLATPATMAALVSFGAVWDLGDVLLALGLVAALTLAALAGAGAVEARVGRLPLREAGRALAGLLVLMAVAMAVDGVNSV